jgi:soluble lytic murein transglycosylase
MSIKKFFSIPVLTVAMLLAISAAMISHRFWLENRYAPLITSTSLTYGHDPFLVKAIIRRESNFRPRARGNKGEIGLMQVTPSVGWEYAKSKGVSNFTPAALYDPTLNIEVGCWYLAKAMRRYRSFRDPVPFALAHYNAGAGNVDRWLMATRQRGNAREFMAAITYPATRKYVRFITRHRKLYRLFSF